MMLARITRVTLTPGVQTILKTPVSSPLLPKIQISRLFGNDGRTTFARSARKRASAIENVIAPAGETAFNVGRAAVAGGAVLGLGALCYYGLGLTPATGAIDNAMFWPEYVRERIRTTYAYFGGSIVVSAAAAAACLRSPAIMNLVMRQGWIALGATIAAMMGTGMIAHSIPYQEGFGTKQIAWLAHSGVLGAVLAPLTFMGGPVLIRAAWCTAAIVASLSTVAVCAPSEKFLNMGGPLAIGFGVVFASSIGTFFLPPTTALGAGVHSMAIYGGLLLFSAFLLYDTQKIIRNAETIPYDKNSSVKYYDPINNAMQVYLDTMNIFVRLVHIFGSGNRRN